MKKISPFLLLLFFLNHTFGQAPLTQFGSDVFVSTSPNTNVNSAISGDGLTTIIGSSLYPNGTGVGLARIFKYISGNWQQLGGDINGEVSGEEFGSEVSISDDGLTVAIGAWKKTTSSLGWGTGYVKVYNLVSGNWVQKGESLFGQNVNGQFGKEIWLSGDGNTMVVRAQITIPPQNQYLKIFNFSSGSWNLSYIFEPVSGIVDLSSNGTRLAIGSAIWDLISNQWVRTDNNFYPSYLGITSVSLSGDGNTLAIGNYNGFFVYKNYGGSNWQYSYGENIPGYPNTILDINFGGNVAAVWNNTNQIIKTYQFINDSWTYFGYLPNATSVFNLSSNGSKILNSTNIYINNQLTVKVYDTSSLLGSEEFDSFNFTVYPNPAKNEINIKMGDNSVLEKVNLYNMMGQKIHESTSNSLDISWFQKGCYLLEVITDKTKETKRVVFE